MSQGKEQIADRRNNAAEEVGGRCQVLLERGGFRLDVDLALPAQGVTGVFGASGCGKTTLLRCLAGLESGTRGEIRVGSEHWQNESLFLPPQDRRVAYVFQEPRLFPHLSVEGNLRYGQRRAGDDATMDFAAVVRLLGLEDMLTRRPAGLSGGEAQRVSIARALLRGPRLVLMDEPLAALDATRKAEILPFLDRLHGELAIPMLYVSHSIDELTRLCDRLAVMDAGRIVAQGALSDLLARGDLPGLGLDETGVVVDLIVTDYLAQDDLSTASLNGSTLYIPGRIPSGPARVRILARDVSLTRQAASDSSILNQLPVQIAKIEAPAGAYQLIRVDAAGQPMLARITRRSVRQLSLAEGDQVCAQIKSIAVRSTAIADHRAR